MSNKPDDPRRPNPDDKPSSAAPPKSHPGADKSADPGSESAIDLGKLGEGEVSGISVIEWAALVDDPVSSKSKVRIDAPSDMDLLGQLADKAELPKGTPLAEEDIAELIAEAEAEAPFRLEDESAAPTHTKAVDDDALFADMMAESVDLGGEHPSGVIVQQSEHEVYLEEPVAAEPGVDSGSFVDLGATALIEDDIAYLGGSDSGAIDLGDEAVIVEEVAASAGQSDVIDLGMDAIIVEESDDDFDAVDLASASALVGKASESDRPIDLGRDAMIYEESSDEAIDLGADTRVVNNRADPGSNVPSSIDLSGTASATSGQSDSGLDMLEDDLRKRPLDAAPKKRPSRDLIAEGLESGTDLLGAAKARAKHDEDALYDDFLSENVRADQSSSVDLGSAADLELFDEAQRSAKSHGATGADSDIRIEDVAEMKAASDDYVDIDLEQIKDSAPKKKGKAAAAVSTDELESFAGEELEAGFDEAPIGKKGKKAKPVIEEGEDEEAPKKGKKAKSEDEGVPVKAGGKGGAWIGGTFLGTLVGVGAVAGLLIAGVIPAEYLGYLGIQPAGEKKVTDVGKTNPTPVITFAQTLDKIRNGDLDQVKPGDLEAANKPEEFVGRAEFHWLTYLRDVRGKDPLATLKDDAEPVKLALADIEKASTGDNLDAKADALFLRGQIEELTGKQAKAKATYAEGAKDFPAQKARFENAQTLVVLIERTTALPPGLPRDMLVALIVMLQDPGGNKPPAPVGEEAGYRFWEALKLARDGKTAGSVKALDDAVKALDDARSRHDQGRFLRPRKPQNPMSDPREEIFLKACDELRIFWKDQAKLKNEGYLDAVDKDRIPEVDKLLAKAEDKARDDQLKGLTKLFEGKKIVKADDLVALVQAERKAVDADKLTQKTKLDDQQTKLDRLDKDAKLADKKIEATEKSLKETQAVAKKAQDDAAAATAVLKQVGETVGSEFTDVKASRESLLREVRESVRAAKTVDPRGTIKQLERDLVVDRAKLAQRWDPAEMLGFWVPILQKERDRKDLGGRAMVDVKRVLEDVSSKDEPKAQALLVQGLVERNAEKYHEAKATLTKARAGLLGSKGDWLSVCDEALVEVSDPAADIAKRARQLESSGKKAEAIAVLDRGLKSLSDRKGPLYLQKAKAAIESARSKGPIKAADPLVQSAQKDAAEAAKEGLPEGYFVAGRIEEDLGQIKEAIENYRAAIKAHGKNDAEGSRYRIALARALLKQRGTESSSLAAPRPEAVALRSGVSVETVAVLTFLTLQAAGLPGDKPASSAEAEKLADEILALGDKAPFDARAQALAIKGLHTRALQVYTAGLRDSGLLSAEHANTLLDLINAHPVLKRPDSLTTPDPTQAEKYYNSGLNFYSARKYESAEKEFLSAIQNDKADARYYYFLGLSRLAQGKREAVEDFDQGARLEQQGKPGRAAVSTALERVQGPMRERLTDVRSRPVRERSK